MLATAVPSRQAQGVSQDDGLAADIVVTASKRSERLSQTPQTVNVVTGDQINELNLTNFEDISKVVPGLQICRGDGCQQAVLFRGVTFDTDTGTIRLLSSNPTFYKAWTGDGELQASILRCHTDLYQRRDILPPRRHRPDERLVVEPSSGPVSL